MHSAKIELNLENAEQIAKAIQPSLESQKITANKNKITVEVKSDNLSLLRAYINTALRLAKLSLKTLSEE